MPFERSILNVGENAYTYYPVAQVQGADALPYSLKILLENVIRNVSDAETASAMVSRIVQAGTSGQQGEEIEFAPARVLFQDFTGVPVFVDFAAMREACSHLGGDPKVINPQIPCDLVVDHSVIADAAGCPQSLEVNFQLEYQRNKERYEFLKWAQASFDNVRIVPPGQGICHQLNIEQFSHVAMVAPDKSGEASPGHSGQDVPLVYFDTVVGTDSHTPTANGIGVLGWGVGGIEAEAAALGQPITTLVPKVIGVHLTGKLSPEVTAMDTALTFAEMLRAQGVVGCFVECFGDGVETLSATQRACISNMTPEYGCTCTLFPIDERTIDFLRMTGRSDDQVALVEAYAKAQGFWGQSGLPDGQEASSGTNGRIYSDVLEFDLSAVAASAAGPSRPHDRFALADIGTHFKRVSAARELNMDAAVAVDIGGAHYDISHGAVAIAAVTSCTTATDPAMMLQAGLLARNAAQRGLKSQPWVKTIFAPGSHSTELLLERAGLLRGLQELGFYTCGFGCMSCIGNSGPLSDQMHDASQELELASVLSGNRNFEGRISPDVSQNYLMSPAHVIALALVGTVDFDPESQPLGHDADGVPVYLRDVLPSQDEVDRFVAEYVTPDLYQTGCRGMYEGDEVWKGLNSVPTDLYAWDDASTYVRHPPYFDGMTLDAQGAPQINDAVVLALLGDFVTTDHISPAGAIAPDMPAARYLREHAIKDADFNTYGSRRGNHEVMMRGTLANVKLKNGLAKGKLGGYTTNVLTGSPSTIYDAAKAYMAFAVPSIILAGKLYGSGSSRDWAAKGPMLLGVKAVIAESFERIHRSNLIGMGVLPLQFTDGQNAETLGLDGAERFTISGITFSDGMPENELVHVKAVRADGAEVHFDALVRIDTPTEGKYYENGGILQYVLRDLIRHG